MKIFSGTIGLVIIITFVSYAQQQTNPLNKLSNKFEAFKYTEVIVGADSLLNAGIELTDNQLVEIFRMKGIAEYSLLEDASARKSFTSILNINKNYELDSAKTSPKIITFFNQVKNKFLLELKKKENEQLAGRQDSSNIPGVFYKNTSPDQFRKTIIRSLLVPGLGHLYNGENLKGAILTSLGAASLASMIYFIIDSNNKQNDYLNSTDQLQIKTRYDEYNKSYKLKNISIITFALVWLYSQVDILFFTEFNTLDQQVSANTIRLNYDDIKGVQLGLNIRL